MFVVFVTSGHCGPLIMEKNGWVRVQRGIRKPDDAGHFKDLGGCYDYFLILTRNYVFH